MARKHDKRRRNGQPKRKISGMIWEFAGDFIRMAETPEQRQSQLNAACSAWNMACNARMWGKTLDQYMLHYHQFNAGADRAELVGVRSNMEKLIQKKLEMFSGDLRRIVDARLVRMGDKDRIEVVSATFS